MRYTQQQKTDALRRVRLANDDFDLASEQTGIPKATLRKWQTQHQAERAERLVTRLQRLEEDLIENTLRIMESLEGAIEKAPLNQRTSAVGTLIDRFLKVNAHLRESVDARAEKKELPIVYYDPDTTDTSHPTPQWAREDSENDPSFQGGRVWSPFWEDRLGHNGVDGTRAQGEDVLVARPDLLNGDASLAGFEAGDENSNPQVRIS